MKRFMLSTALVALTMTPALAQTAGDTAGGTMTGTSAGVGAAGSTFYQGAGMNDIFASDFIGKSVYVTQTEVQGTRMGRTGAGMGTGTGAGGMGADTGMAADTGTGAGTGMGATGTTATDGTTALGTDTTDLTNDPAAGTAAPGAATDTTGAAGTGAAGTGDTGAVGTGATGTGAADTGATGGMTGTAAGVQGVQEDWEDIGTIDDVVMTREGEIQAVLVDVGGFLGMGARTVAVDIDSLNIVDDADGNDFYVVFTSSREELENAPEYDRDAANQGAMDGTATGAAGTAGGVQGQDQPLQGQAQGQGQGWMTPDEGYGMVDRAAISVDELTNANLYDANNDNVANVSDVVVGTDGQIQALVADVGGFLGIGTHTVALDFNEVEIHRDEGGMGTDLRVYVPMTREELEAMPEYQQN
ncbi:PRC-barrel domain-containing protein [Plastorhodobacter daqingensis]|uniref:PRC-barrel domain-containing protein n=1 Tax=Plastorhodobacter daqingensis TaxID=1387281 RepID=A0ABW2UQ57_9RHOB